MLRFIFIGIWVLVGWGLGALIGYDFGVVIGFLVSCGACEVLGGKVKK